MITPWIEKKAEAILRETNVYYLPIPVVEVARRLKLSVEAASLGENVSGLLVLRDGNGAVIGYNNSHSEVRQRFTIAHEIGHFVLHQEQTHKSLFIDKKYAAVYARNDQSSTGENKYEIQANAFAAALLMPTDLLRTEIDLTGFDLADERVLSELAKKFKVSTQAMAYRLANLGVLSYQE